VPGAQTVYPPGHGRYAEISHADGFDERDYLSRSTIESIEQALEESESKTARWRRREARWMPRELRGLRYANAGNTGCSA